MNLRRKGTEENKGVITAKTSKKMKTKTYYTKLGKFHMLKMQQAGIMSFSIFSTSQELELKPNLNITY